MIEKNSERLNNNKKGRSISELAMCGLFVAIAMIFSYVESLLPIPFPVPGMRLGFANIAIITVLYMYGERDAFAVNLVRIILSAMLFGNINSFFVQSVRWPCQPYRYDLFKKDKVFLDHWRKRARWRDT